jgi:purine-binding chemotaxis protein CheW
MDRSSGSERTMGNALARSAHGTPSSRDSRVAGQYLMFNVRDSSYAVPIESIREVVELTSLTRMPLAPAVVPGVLNLRGSVVPVVDLSVRIGGPPSTIGRRTCVIIVELGVDGGSQLLGVIVDAVSEALEVEARQLEPKPAFGAGLRTEFVAGMLNLSGRFVVVLDLAQLLSLSDLEQLVTAEALTHSPGEASA